MCGRYSLTTPPEAMRDLFGVETLLNMPARYNIAPTQTAPVVRRRADDGDREMATMRWGLIPSWAKDMTMAARMINARSETVAEKPSFRRAYRQRRCLVPSDGFYEWQKTDDGKQPWRICMRDRGLFAFAGLYETWTGPDGSVDSYTILTTVANRTLIPVHPRMPVILQPTAYAAWLGEEDTDLSALLTPYPDAELDAYRIGKRVGNVRNDDAGVLEPMEEVARLL